MISNMGFERLVVVGAGAIGGTIAGMLAANDHAVLLVARGEHGESIRQDGLQVKFPHRTLTSHPSCVASVEQVDFRPGDVVLVATKLYDAEEVMDGVLRRAGSKVPMVTAFNRVQGEAWAMERFETVIGMLIWMPSVYLHPGDIRVYGEDCPGVLDVGPYQGEAAMKLAGSLAKWLSNSRFDSVVRDDIQRWKYAKWISNLGNAAQALVVDDWKSVARAAQAEGELVLNAAGFDRVSTGELLDRARHIRLKPVDGEKRPGGSTWQSLQRGQPLETPWLEGAMAELAEQSGVKADVCRAIANAAQDRRQVSAGEILNGT